VRIVPSAAARTHGPLFSIRLCTRARALFLFLSLSCLSHFFLALSPTSRFLAFSLRKGHTNTNAHAYTRTHTHTLEDRMCEIDCFRLYRCDHQADYITTGSDGVSNLNGDGAIYPAYAPLSGAEATGSTTQLWGLEQVHTHTHTIAHTLTHKYTQRQHTHVHTHIQMHLMSSKEWCER